MDPAADVEAYRAGLGPEQRRLVDEVRALVAGSHEGLEESIKWNAPSFSHRGEDRITLGLDRKGGVRIVLHRGAKNRDDDFRFDDPAGLAEWRDKDRGVVTIDSEGLGARREQLADLFARWIDATSPRSSS